ncbi:hypothetical protein KCU81_g39, partial [Aureobasidium melanogenum]
MVSTVTPAKSEEVSFSFCCAPRLLRWCWTRKVFKGIILHERHTSRRQTGCRTDNVNARILRAKEQHASARAILLTMPPPRMSTESRQLCYRLQQVMDFETEFAEGRIGLVMQAQVDPMNRRPASCEIVPPLLDAYLCCISLNKSKRQERKWEPSYSA